MSFNKEFADALDEVIARFEDHPEKNDLILDRFADLLAEIDEDKHSERVDSVPTILAPENLIENPADLVPIELGRYSRISGDSILMHDFDNFILHSSAAHQFYMRISPSATVIPPFNIYWRLGKRFAFVDDNGEELQFELMGNVSSNVDEIYSAYINFRGDREPIMNYWYNLVFLG